MTSLADYRFGVGVMSKNVVDACIDYVNKHDRRIMFIPSRRQVEYSGGYANNWTTQSFTQYVRERTDKALLVRDHAGPNQGLHPDNGLLSLDQDCLYFDLIHIDPWKMATFFEKGIMMTASYLQYCFDRNPEIQYEIGTEQAIFEYSASQLDYLISFMKGGLDPALSRQIRYAVIQSGTALLGNTNTGTYDAARLEEMIAVCRKYGLLSKEHNGDYLSTSLIKTKFSLGLDSVNIAPEFGQIETQTYLGEIGSLNLLDTYYKICYNSGKWLKWLDPNQPISKTELINVCGHYVVSYPAFIEDVKNKLRPDIDDLVKDNLTRKLNQLYNA